MVAWASETHLETSSAGGTAVGGFPRGGGLGGLGIGEVAAADEGE